MKLKIDVASILARARQPTFMFFSARRCELFKAHVLDKINQAVPGVSPFDHVFIEGIFPEPLYRAIKARMYYYKYNKALQERHQDSAKFMNRRYNLVGNFDPETRYLREIFSDPVIKHALLSKFYLDPTAQLADSLEIHEEFEYMYTAAGRFQNIHVDIPPKFMSFVFYFPENPVSKEAEKKNATILYDKNLQPHYNAKYKSNSLCIFVPHFYSYHGFSSTIDREVLILFYINQAEKAQWAIARKCDVPPYESVRDRIQAKLEAHPLISYGRDPDRIREERAKCLINAPQGRIMRKEEVSSYDDGE